MTALSPREAREVRKPALERASKIRYGMRAYIDTLGLIHQAWADRDDVKLGYPSWEAYYNTEFSEERVRLTPEMRDKAITELRIAGMSQRQIATSTGLSAATVNRHLNSVAGETDILEGDIVPPADSQLVDALKVAINDATDRAEDHRADTPGAAVPPAAGTATEGVGETSSDPTASDPEPDRIGSGPDPGAAGVEPAPAAPPVQERGEEGGPPCEACGVTLTRATSDLGFMRCADCDPNGTHIADGDGCAACAPKTCPTCGQSLPT